jgi:hypothetical protein
MNVSLRHFILRTFTIRIMLVETDRGIITYIPNEYNRSAFNSISNLKAEIKVVCVFVWAM